MGPWIYLDLTFCFFLINIPLFSRNQISDPSRRRNLNLQRTTSARQILPFLLNLNLKPLYSSLGGSTTRAEPLIKRPSVECRLRKPL